MKKTIAIIALSLLFAGVIAILAYDIITQKSVDSKMLLRAFLAGGSFAAAIVRIVTGDRAKTKKRYALYANNYAHVLRKAFAGEQHAAEYKQLMHCIDLWCKNEYAKALKSLRALEKACRYTDDYCAVYAFSALSCSDQGNIDDAILYYRKVLEHNEERSTEWSNLGLLLDARGDLDEAIHCYEQAIRYDKDNPMAYSNLAHAYYKEGEYDAAIEQAKIALQKDNKTYQAATLLCLIYHIWDDTEESDKYYKIAVANGQSASALRLAKQRVK